MHAALRPLPPLLLLGAIWGATPAFVKHLGAAGWPPILIATFSAAGSAVILLAACRLRGTAVPLSQAHLRHYAVSGLFGLALANLVGFTSLQHVPAAFLLYFRSLAAHGGVITSQAGYVVTLAGIAWGSVLFGERPGWLTIPTAALVFAGLALVTLPGRRVSRSGA